MSFTITTQIRRMILLSAMENNKQYTTAELRKSGGEAATAVSETTIRNDAQWLVDQQYPVVKRGTANRIIWVRI